jgi:hypothetical protein
MKRTPQTVWFSLSFAVLLVGVGFFLFEIGLRVLFRGRFAPLTEPTESLFWIRDDDLGWTHRPGSSGEFSNGFFHGVVHIDDHGNRRNAAAETFVREYPTILFIGDSTVASFEVDDGDTVPAILERRLRAQHRAYNVINLGVRGYGTDQSVRRALAFGAQYQPTDVIYMFVDNDMYDNNVLRQPGRIFAKGAYIRASEGGHFEPYHYPVPEARHDFAGLVVLDDNCAPVVHEVPLSGEHLRSQSSQPHDAGYSYTYRAIKELSKAARPEGFDAVSRIDPFRMISKARIKWNVNFFHAYKIYGSVRRRCSSYLEDQVTFLLQQLRRIQSVQRVHVLHFPGDVVLRFLRQDGPPLDRTFFNRLVADSVIDTYLDLPQAVLSPGGPDPIELACERDGHFCRRGNEWIAAQILSKIHFEDVGSVALQQ